MRQCSTIGTNGRTNCLKKRAVPLDDAVTEADELFQNAGEKGQPHRDPDDPPRRRANQRRGLGTWENDRPPIQGVVGRQSGQIRLTVCPNTQRATLQPRVESTTPASATVYTDEATAYQRLGETGRTHRWVCHSRRE